MAIGITPRAIHSLFPRFASLVRTGTSTDSARIFPVTPAFSKVCPIPVFPSSTSHGSPRPHLTPDWDSGLEDIIAVRFKGAVGTAYIIPIRVEVSGRIGRNGLPQTQIGSTLPAGIRPVTHCFGAVLPGCIRTRTPGVPIHLVRSDRVGIICPEVLGITCPVYRRGRVMKPCSAPDQTPAASRAGRTNSNIRTTDNGPVVYRPGRTTGNIRAGGETAINGGGWDGRTNPA